MSGIGALCRVSGPDPQRRKMSHTSFYAAHNGSTSLSASATLFLASQPTTSQQKMGNRKDKSDALQVYALCSGEIISPFLVTSPSPSSSSSSSSSSSPPVLHPEARIEILVEKKIEGENENDEPIASEEWWTCELKSLLEIDGVDTAISVLTQNSSDWELGWCKPNYPPPIYQNQESTHMIKSNRSNQSAVVYPNGQKRSAAVVAVLQVVCRSADLDDTRPKRQKQQDKLQPSVQIAPSNSSSPTAASFTPSPSRASKWPSSCPAVTPATFPAFPLHSWQTSNVRPARGTNVIVYSSPYGLLSPHIFHNTMTTGIVSNWVSLDERERKVSDPAKRSGSHFSSFTSSSNERQSCANLLSVPPSLLLMDVRCFAGSEGAPVLLDQKPSLDSTASSTSSILGITTLPIHHTTRGSAIELNLAIPMYLIQHALHSKLRLMVWTPSMSAATNSHLLSNQTQGRGEGWRILQAARKPIAASHTAATMASPTAAAAKSSPLPISSISSRSMSSSSGSNFSYLPPTAAKTAVDRAERSVVMAKIGGSWASAIVLTADGYLLTNAHLLRPFMDNPTPNSQDDSITSYDENSSLTLLVGEAIRLKPYVRVSVRIEPHHLASDVSLDSVASVGWVSAKLVYVSQGAWDVALLKIDCVAPLYPVLFHPSFRSRSVVDSISSPSSATLPIVGSHALAVGHALFSPASALLPTVTRGILSKIVSLPLASHLPSTEAAPTKTRSKPCLLVTCAAVHNGNSGGLLIDERSGYLLGMVTSNVMHKPVDANWFPVQVRTQQESWGANTEESVAALTRKYEENLKAEEENRQAQSIATILPHLNFSIPYTALLPLLEFCETGAKDYALLREMDDAPAIVQRLWQLTELYPSEPAQPDFSPRYTELVKRLEQEAAEAAKDSTTSSPTSASAPSNQHVTHARL